MVAGIGSRRGAGAADVLAAIDRTLDLAGRSRAEITAIATAAVKASESGIAEAAAALGVPCQVIPMDRIAAASPYVETVSAAVQDRFGVPSIAEAAALAAAGPTARLLLPRQAVGPVTCALVEGAS